MTILHRYLEEPISAITHLVGAMASLVGMVILLLLARGSPGRSLSLAIYGSSMVVLFAASSLFHGAKLKGDGRYLLNRLDHAAIFLLIAGTYTPIVYNLFPVQWRWYTLVLIWTIALVGIAYKLVSSQIHGLFNTSIYPLISWAGVVPAILAYRIQPLVPRAGLLLLILGGLVYMLGFVIYYRRWPNPWPGVFGHHEIWHIFVMGGSLLHYVFVLFFVALK
ncbi:MAG: hemolysin III family protein [Candidatus Promineifilaceae bacterium]